MDRHDATEQAYRNGYAEGFAAAKAAIVPCKMGEPVFALRRYNGQCILKRERVIGMEYDKDMQLKIHVRHTCKDGLWGVDVFGKEADALAALQKHVRSAPDAL